ncbi:MAG: hypothetical protein LLF94_10465 [Chlamydiales bacterium]|nr:hypothetical protein [Chlamydiales bacterium]
MNLFSLSLISAAYCIDKVVPKKPCDPNVVKAAYGRITQVARNIIEGKITITQVDGINVADFGAQWHLDRAFVYACHDGKLLEPVVEVQKSTARIITADSSLLDPLMQVVDSIGVPATVAIGVGAATLCGYVIYKLCTSKD